jgi:ubiquinone/menaquinone biosynthesis C-methylase UbiE
LPQGFWVCSFIDNLKKEKAMNHFDEQAPQWEQKAQRTEMAQQVAAAIQRRVPLHAAMTAMEYGCGTGLVGLALRPFLQQLLLTDSSSGMLQVVEEKIRSQNLKNVLVQKLDLVNQPPLAQTFDLIFTSMTLHHVADVQKVLRAFRTLLKAGGYLCIADLDMEDGSFHDHVEYVHKGFDRRTLQDTVKQIGFDQISCETIYTSYKMRAGENKGYPIFLLSAIAI